MPIKSLTLIASLLVFFTSGVTACNRNYDDDNPNPFTYDLCLGEVCLDDSMCTTGLYCVGARGLPYPDTGNCNLPVWSIVVLSLVGVGLCVGGIFLCLCCACCAFCPCNRHRKTKIVEKHHYYEQNHRRITGEIANTVSFPNQQNNGYAYQQAPNPAYNYAPPHSNRD